MLLARLFEYIASMYVDTQTLDKLTYDTTKASTRALEKGIRGAELRSDMFQICWKANLISFLADYTVQQLILLGIYVAYVQNKRRRLKEKQEAAGTDERGADDDDSDSESDSNEDVWDMIGPLTYSFIRKSTNLAISQGVCLGFASLGGAIGAVIFPTRGIATTVGANLGGSLGDQVASVFVTSGTRLHT